MGTTGHRLAGWHSEWRTLQLPSILQSAQPAGQNITLHGAVTEHTHTHAHAHAHTHTHTQTDRQTVLIQGWLAFSCVVELATRDAKC